MTRKTVLRNEETKLTVGSIAENPHIGYTTFFKTGM